MYEVITIFLKLSSRLLCLRLGLHQLVKIQEKKECYVQKKLQLSLKMAHEFSVVYMDVSY